MIFIAFPSNVSGQDVIFQSCMNANDYNEIIHCEKEKIGQIIKNRIWPLYKDYQRNYSPSNLKLSFDIKSRSVIANIKIIETPKSPVVSVSNTFLHIQDSIIQGFVLLAQKNGTEGQAVVTFIVERDGYISEINIAREIGDGCGQAAVKVVESMNDMLDRFIPGRQRGRPVRVFYTLPVKFKL